MNYDSITKASLNASQRKSMLHAMKLSYKLCLLRQLRRPGTEVRAKFPESKSATSAVQHILSSHLVSPYLEL